MVLTDWWVRESDLGSSFKGYMGYKEVLGGKDDIGGPNQANPEALAFILWCPKAISKWFENPVILGLINELGLTPLPPLQTMSAFLTVFFVRELPLKVFYVNFMLPKGLYHYTKFETKFLNTGLFTHRSIYKEKLLPLCCINYVYFSVVLHI